MNDHENLEQERLTAYALNELDGAERAAVEAQLKNDPAAQRHVEDVRATASLLATELKQERLSDLARALSAGKAASAAPSRIGSRPVPTSRFVYYATAVAAMLVMGVTLWSVNRSGKDREVLSLISTDSPTAKSTPAETARNEGPLGQYSKRDAEERPAARKHSAFDRVKVGAEEVAKVDADKRLESAIAKETNARPLNNGTETDAKSNDEEKAPHAVSGLTRVPDPNAKTSDASGSPDLNRFALDKADVPKVDSNIGGKPATLAPPAPPVTEKPATRPEKKEKDLVAPEPLRATVPQLPPDRGRSTSGIVKKEPEARQPEGLKQKSAEDRFEAHADYHGLPNRPNNPVPPPPVASPLAPIPPVSVSPPPAEKPAFDRGEKFDFKASKTPSPKAAEATTITGQTVILDDRSKEAAALKRDVDELRERINGAPGGPKKEEEPFLKLIGGGINIPPLDPQAPKASLDVSAGLKNTVPAAPLTPMRGWSHEAITGQQVPGETAELKKKIERATKESFEDLIRAGKTPPVSQVDKMMDNKYGPPPSTPGVNYYIKGNNGKTTDKEAMGGLDFAERSDTAKRPDTIHGTWWKDGDEYKKDKPVPDGFVLNYQVVPEVPPVKPTAPIPGGETYVNYQESGFFSARTDPLSTFSADVDTASYSNTRRFLTQGQLPPPQSVRVAELVNYFKYNFGTIKTGDPFGANVEAAACPWNAAHRLVRVAIRANDLGENRRPSSNLVFLIDVSGSMDDARRLPLVKEGMKSLIKRLGESDRVAIVTYAGTSGIALPSTNCSEKDRIIQVIDSLRADGSTNGGAGIQTAYTTARENFIKGGTNRVILATDGDFNVGVTDPNELVRMIEAQRSSGVFLTALGYGMGNVKDATLQRIANAGNGHYAYIDTAEESRKVLIEEINATLVTVAKDVKFQVEFNPAQAGYYRLIGYEKRELAAQDFNNDAKDAGEVGAGHRVTAFYEVAPAYAVQPQPNPSVDKLRYQESMTQLPTPPAQKEAVGSSELLTLKIRYKQPDGNESKKLEFAFTDKNTTFEQATTDFKFAASVALFGQLLKRSQYIQGVSMRRAVEIADENRGNDEGGYRREFVQLARKAAELRGE